MEGMDHDSSSPSGANREAFMKSYLAYLQQASLMSRGRDPKVPVGADTSLSDVGQEFNQRAITALAQCGTNPDLAMAYPSYLMGMGLLPFGSKLVCDKTSDSVSVASQLAQQEVINASEPEKHMPPVKDSPIDIINSVACNGHDDLDVKKQTSLSPGHPFGNMPAINLETVPSVMDYVPDVQPEPFQNKHGIAQLLKPKPDRITVPPDNGMCMPCLMQTGPCKDGKHTCQTHLSYDNPPLIPLHHLNQHRPDSGDTMDLISKPMAHPIEPQAKKKKVPTATLR